MAFESSPETGSLFSVRLADSTMETLELKGELSSLEEVSIIIGELLREKICCRRSWVVSPESSRVVVLDKLDELDRSSCVSLDDEDEDDENARKRSCAESVEEVAEAKLEVPSSLLSSFS